MIERELVVPVPAERLWHALTDPAVLDEWFESSVTWDLRPGGEAHFDGHDGLHRQGLVTEVLPGRRLSFRWWEEGGEASEVTYRLDPDGDGDATHLVVTERQVEPAAPGLTGPEASVDAGSWTAWDSRLLGAWAFTCSATCSASVRVIGGRR